MRFATRSTAAPPVPTPLLLGLALVFAASAVLAEEPQAIGDQPTPRNVVVYRQPGRFGGWPANHGMWVWGHELLVGFSAGYHKDNGPGRHAIDHDRPEEHLLARSVDGGLTWTIENPAVRGDLIPVGDALHGITPPGLVERPWQDCPGEVPFRHPAFALTARMTNGDHGPSRFYYSVDRGHAWKGPFRLPDFEGAGVAARTDYIVNGPDDCLLFLTVAKRDGHEGRPLAVRTRDGGKTWQFQGWIADEPTGLAIMPSTVRLGPRELLSAVRRHEGPRRWIETYRSPDDGHTWLPDTVPAPNVGEGNPAAMLRLADGRVCVTYGVRREPFGIRARVSANGGHGWGPELVLRDDGGGRDVGYPRSVQLPCGQVVTVYYFHDTPLGERYIAATIWRP